MTVEDRQLLLDTHRGSDAAARLLWQRFAPRLLAHAAAIVGRDSAEDVVQAVLCGLLGLPRRRVAAVDDVPAFLAASTRRAALNHLRAYRRESTRRRCLAERPTTPVPHPDDPSADPSTDESLRAGIDALPRRLREVVVLKHIGGLTFDQIAFALALNRNTAAGRYRSAISVLKELLLRPAGPGPMGPDPASDARTHVRTGDVPCMTR